MCNWESEEYDFNAKYFLNEGARGELNPVTHQGINYLK